MPRYEISKLKQMADQDLDITNDDNRGEEERRYGNGKILGKEIDEMIKEESKDRITKNQLASARKTFLNFVKDRSTTATPNNFVDSPSYGLNSGHITEHLLHMNSGLKTSANPRNSSLPKLPQEAMMNSKALNSEYSSFVTSMHKQMA